MKNRVRLSESQLHKVIKESVKHVLKEGTTDDQVISKWEELKETVGAEQMLDCIFSWCNSDQLEQFIEWFEEEGYLDYEY